MPHLDRHKPGDVHQLLKCVWSGYPADSGRCHAHIPAGVPRDAWRRQMAVKHTSEGFFEFSWRGETWLAYGASDGSVRGVYCAIHSAERAARIVGVERSPTAVGE
jgi:hypothetical protein